MKHDLFMRRCIELAAKAIGNVAPNPMVGAVLVYKDRIIGEGYHQKYGEAHAEVNAINSVSDKSLLAFSTLYVSLEPCNHYGKTPPCTQLILKHKIPNVVIGCRDLNKQVKGSGIEALKAAGVNVTSGILQEACLDLNKRFFYFLKTQRPYVILKWAASKDGYIGSKTIGNVIISNEHSRQLVHKWRSEEAAILVGSNTAEMDNPTLTVRDYPGKNPIRIVIDRQNKLSAKLKLFDQISPTIVFTRKPKKSKLNLEYIELPASANELENVLNLLGTKNIQSVLVEGGAEMLQSFIDKGIWNEARVFSSEEKLKGGIKSPILSSMPLEKIKIKKDTLAIYKNNKL
jgi:diaminohydroxyphosphoribosylaminopyrimidine deaminase/5-amino-6-(5-phosphoribosylamino)uracil reductase